MLSMSETSITSSAIIESSNWGRLAQDILPIPEGYLAAIVQHQWVMLAVLVFILMFLARFVIPSGRNWRNLRQVLSGLQAFKTDKNNLSEVGKLFQDQSNLRHIWDEYAHTLHTQKVVDSETGIEKVARVRSTVPAEFYFKQEALVDTVVHSEFYKHLPGILTGLGIIGTFFGLMEGLDNFLQSLAVAQKGEAPRVNELLVHVRFAFMVSATAIGAAVVITLVEKWLLAVQYKVQEEIGIALDSFYDSGVGEEYLSSLVKASEGSYVKQAQMAEKLIEQFGQIISQQTERTLEANKQNSEAISKEIGSAIEGALAKPMEALTNTVQLASGDQGERVSDLMTSALTHFSQKLEDLFGGQITGLSTLQQETNAVLQATTQELRNLIAGMRSAGESSATSMSEKLQEALTAMELKQRVLNEQMTDFVRQIKELVSRTQEESNTTLNQAIQDLARTMQSLIDEMKTSTRSAIDDIGRGVIDTIGKGQESQDKVNQVSGALSESINQLIQEISSNTTRLGEVTSSAINKLNDGAEQMYVAADSFTKATDGTTLIVNRIAEVATGLQSISNEASTAATSLRSVVQDQANSRNAIQLMVASLEGIVESAKREASISTTIVSTIEEASRKLSQSAAEFDDYLNGVSSVLTQSQGAFNESVKTALQQSNNDFHEKLSEATGLLAGAVAELGSQIQAGMVKL